MITVQIPRRPLGPELRGGQVWRPKGTDKRACLSGPDLSSAPGQVILQWFNEGDGPDVPTGAPFTLNVDSLRLDWELAPETKPITVKQVWRRKSDGLEARVESAYHNVVHMLRPGLKGEPPVVKFDVAPNTLRADWEFVSFDAIKVPKDDRPRPIKGTYWRRNSDGLVAKALESSVDGDAVFMRPEPGGSTSLDIATPVDLWRSQWTMTDSPVPAAPELRDPPQIPDVPVEEAASKRKHSHYFFDVSHLNEIDIYRMIQLLQITDPAMQHAFKKVAMAGKRGAKNAEQDAREAIDSVNRFLQMRAEDCNAAPAYSTLTRDEDGAVHVEALGDPHRALRNTWEPKQRWQTRVGGVSGEWVDTRPRWHADQEYRRHPDDFSPWDGSHARGPLKLWGVRGAKVRLKLSGGAIYERYAGDPLRWRQEGHPTDIVGYQIVSLP